MTKNKQEPPKLAKYREFEKLAKGLTAVSREELEEQKQKYRDEKRKQP